MAKSKKLPKKEKVEKEVLYFRGVTKVNAEWFRKEASKLGYTLNQFFDVVIKHYRGK